MSLSNQLLSRSNPIEKFRNGVMGIFPSDHERLIRLCVRRDDYPLGFGHPQILMEILGMDLLEDDLQDLQTGYVFISSYYFLLDAVVDGHLENKTDALYLSHLLAGAILLFEKVCRNRAPERLRSLRQVVSVNIAQNAAAVESEFEFLANPLKVVETEEYTCTVNRSNSVILLYQVLCILSQKEPDQHIQNILQDLIYYLQHGDDLGDWREDYQRRKWTPFLRSCFQRNERILSEQEIESFVYLSGYYEERAATIIRGLQSISDRLKVLPTASQRLQDLVISQQERMTGTLRNFVATKLSVTN